MFIVRPLLCEECRLSPFDRYITVGIVCRLTRFGMDNEMSDTMRKKSGLCESVSSGYILILFSGGPCTNLNTSILPPVLYLVSIFVIVPLLLLGISYLFNGEVVPSIFGTMCIGLLGYASHKSFTLLESRNKTKTITSSVNPYSEEKIENNINTIVVSN